jgi:hypothetical protein
MTTDRGRSVKWPGVSRDGDPELIRGPQTVSGKLPNKYRIRTTLRTTQIPAGADGYNWVQFFNAQFTGPRKITGYHDGESAIVECWPDDASKLIETVDAAIEYANERVKDRAAL